MLISINYWAVIDCLMVDLTGLEPVTKILPRMPRFFHAGDTVKHGQTSLDVASPVANFVEWLPSGEKQPLRFGMRHTTAKTARGHRPPPRQRIARKPNGLPMR